MAAAMVVQTDHVVAVGTGVKLECQAFTVTGSTADAAAVVFHPWAWLGGSMFDATVTELCKAAVKSGCFSCVVRYNVRGAGSSSGFKSFSAATDAEDALGLCRAILQGCLLPPQQQQDGVVAAAAPKRLALLAYSHGSTVAARLLGSCPEAVAYLSVGFPLGTLSKWFLGSHSSWEALEGSAPSVPRLFLLGTQDQFTDVSTLTGLVEKARAKHAQQAASFAAGAAGGHAAQMGGDGSAAPAGSGRAADDSTWQVRIFEGCDHFFMDEQEDFMPFVIDWLRRHLS